MTGLDPSDNENVTGVQVYTTAGAAALALSKTPALVLLAVSAGAGLMAASNFTSSFSQALRESSKPNDNAKGNVFFIKYGI
jgi:hypothetical protein